MQQVRIDFDNPGLPQSLGVVEGESQSRIFQAALYKSGAAYTAPAGAVYSIMYRGFGPQNQGWYDTIEDGAGKRAACTVSGNVVTCELARQALRVPGHLTVVLCVSDAKGYMLKSWPIMADVRNDGYEDTGEIEMYFNLSGLAGNYLTQLEKAMADAETTKNTLTSTSAQVQKDIDAKAAAALESIPEEYTELDGSVKQLKEELGAQGKISVETYRLAQDKSDDLMFNRAFEVLTNEIIDKNDYTGKYILVIPSGTYTFKTLVRLSPLITYVTAGPVIINSYANTCFSSDASNVPEHFNENDKIDWLKKVWLNFNNCTINNKGISTATGISIGAVTYESGYKNVLAYYTIKGINIRGFGEAFHSYPVNAFLFTLKDCIIENNIYGIVFGKPKVNKGNYGENICLNHCIFGNNNTGCESRADGWLLNFQQCSFDFNRVGFSATGAGIFKFTECHFENNNETQIGTGNYGPIHTTDNSYCAIIADKCTVLEHQNPTVLFTNNAPGTLSLSNMTFVTSFTNLLPNPLFYQCKNATDVFACNSYSYNYALPVNKFDSLIRGDFADVVNSVDIPTFGITTDNYNSGFNTRFDMSYNADLKRRYLKITCTPTSSHGKNAIPYVNFPKFKVDKKLIANAIYKLNDETSNVIIAITYYDNTDTKISTDQFVSTTTTGGYVTNAPAPARFTPPINAFTATIEIQFHMPTTGIEPVSCELYYMWIK